MVAGVAVTVVIPVGLLEVGVDVADAAAEVVVSVSVMLK